MPLIDLGLNQAAGMARIDRTTRSAPAAASRRQAKSLPIATGMSRKSSWVGSRYEP
jgi:hypothetical protein